MILSLVPLDAGEHLIVEVDERAHVMDVLFNYRVILGCSVTRTLDQLFMIVSLKGTGSIGSRIGSAALTFEVLEFRFKIFRKQTD